MHPLKSLMNEYDMGISQTAELFQRTTRTINNWLDGKSYPDMKDLYTFAQAFGRIGTEKLARDWLDWIGNEKVEKENSKD